VQVINCAATAVRRFVVTEFKNKEEKDKKEHKKTKK